jgi:hypothetical protein
MFRTFLAICVRALIRFLLRRLAPLLWRTTRVSVLPSGSQMMLMVTMR